MTLALRFCTTLVTTVLFTAMLIACWQPARAGAPTTTTLASAPNPGPITEPVSLTAVITSEGGSFDAASGPSRLGVGQDHNCAIQINGTVKCWGRNSAGALGDGSTIDRSIPVTVSGLTGAIVVSTGDAHSCALINDGTVKCWGGNWVGMLGDGTTTTHPTPVTVNDISGATALAVSGARSCALINDGTVKCWGANNAGQIGDGTWTTALTPVAVSGLAGVSALGLGYSHSCALMNNGTVNCWGDNTYGQLGDGTGNNHITPEPVSDLVGATAISLGFTHSCALINDGTVRCWGGNTSGGLGNGTRLGTVAPVEVSGLNGIVEISAGYFHSCALINDGTVKCWGWNSNGQIGNGSTGGDYLTPVTTSDISNVAVVGAGYQHTCALLSGGAVKCWGYNGNGQLGDGSDTSHNTPHPVFNPPTGTVNFYDGTTLLGSDNSTNGTASLSTSSLSVGSHSLTAQYVGNTWFDASTSAAHNHTVLDNVPPIVTVPSNITVLNDPGLSSAVVNYTVTASDNSDPSPALARTAGLDSGSAFPLGSTLVTWQAADSSGNTSTPASFTVTVNTNFTGGTGDDTLWGTNIADILNGGDGKDTLSGYDGSDILHGGPGDDYLDGGLGGDTMYGEAGNDTFVVDSTADSVIETNSNVDLSDTVISSITYTLGTNVENLTLQGTSAINGAGNGAKNIIIGNSAINTLSGAGGDDTIEGKGGADVLNGNAGTNTVSYKNAPAGIAVNLNTGVGTAGEAQGDTIANFTTIAGSAFADTIVASNAGNTITGGGLNDTLTGGTRKDTFVYLVITDSTPAKADTINGFSITGSTADVINLSAIDAIPATAAVNDAFTYIGTTAFSRVAGQLRFSSAQNSLLGDTDGNGNADFSINMPGVTSLPTTLIIK